MQRIGKKAKGKIHHEDNKSTNLNQKLKIKACPHESGDEKIQSKIQKLKRPQSQDRRQITNDKSAAEHAENSRKRTYISYE